MTHRERYPWTGTLLDGDGRPAEHEDLSCIPCPSCGERDHDSLCWTEDECLVCTTCGTTFDPEGRADR